MSTNSSNPYSVREAREKPYISVQTFKIKMISIVRLFLRFFVLFNIYGVQAMGTENEPSDRLEGSDGSQRGVV